MSSTRGKSLHLSVCDCPHVNLVIVNRIGQPEAHIAFSADRAEEAGRQLLAMAERCRAKQPVDPIAVPVGDAS